MVIKFQGEPSIIKGHGIIGKTYNIRFKINRNVIEVRLPKELNRLHIRAKKQKLETNSKEINKIIFLTFKLGYEMVDGRINYEPNDQKEIKLKIEAKKKEEQEEKEKQKEEARKIIKSLGIQTKVSFNFPNGFNNIEEVIEAGEKNGLEKNSYMILFFKNKYYGICFCTWNKQLVIAKDKIYARDESGLFTSFGHGLEKLPFKIYTKGRAEIVDTIAIKLKQIDPNLRFYHFKTKKDISYIPLEDEMAEINCLTVLGAISFQKYFTEDDIEDLNNYFKNTISLKVLMSKPEVIAINPYTQSAVLTNGKIVSYRYSRDFYGGGSYYLNS
jgi:hypothetical protein